MTASCTIGVGEKLIAPAGRERFDPLNRVADVG
jgi:hypothetical protein